MKPATYRPWLFRFAAFTAVATLGLVAIGGLVTSKGVGMAVPDWPTSFGYNMFALPISTWLTGGVFHEHTHRQWASVVGVLVVGLTRWLGGEKSRRPLLIIGAIELGAGLAMFKLGAEWRGGGGFLSGIGGVVLLAGLVWNKSAPIAQPLPALGWWVFWLVQLQGLLGGLRVVLNSHVITDVRMGTVFGIFHGCLAQAFLVLLGVITLFTSRWWIEFWQERGAAGADNGPSRLAGNLFIAATTLIFLQLMIGATMRHQHAGLAIPDFPLAYGQLWPNTSNEAVANYNMRRVEITAANAITSFQVTLQMIHRLMAVVILLLTLGMAWVARRWSAPAQRCALALGALILMQASLGAWTIWSNKAADVATGHVVVGALSLVTAVCGCIISLRRLTGARGAQSSASSFSACHPHAPATAHL